jgi:hypothetical protein
MTMENPLVAAAGLLRALAGRFVSIGALGLFSSVAYAGPYKVYGTEFAWDNNFNNSTINSSFSTSSVPGMTVSYNFSSYSLYGYPAIIRGWHYGWNPAGDALFPKQLSATSSIPCTFNYSSGGSNMAGDFAYDMSMYLDVVEAGLEVTRGNGWAYVTANISAH